MATTGPGIVLTKPRPLPVIVLADVSGSMMGEKIAALNHSVRDMIKGFADESRKDRKGEIHVAVITFGGPAQLHTPLQPAARVSWTDMAASGDTPLGGAIDIATALLEDKTKIPERAYTPALILVTDGAPTDGNRWEVALEQLNRSPHAGKAVRLGLLIGAAAGEGPVKAFIGNSEIPVFRVEQTGQIENFFKWVTWSLSQHFRSSVDPGVPPVPPAEQKDSLEDLLFGTGNRS